MPQFKVCWKLLESLIMFIMFLKFTWLKLDMKSNTDTFTRIKNTYEKLIYLYFYFKISRFLLNF